MASEVLSQRCKPLLIREFKSTRPRTLIWQTRTVWTRRLHLRRTLPSPTDSRSSTLRLPGKSGLSCVAKQRPGSVTPHFRPSHGYRRLFSDSPPRLATIVTANPRKDQDGKDMLVDITARASNRLKEIMVKDSNPDLALRVTVESGGCHGFQYLMSLTNSSAISGEDDTVFEATDGTGARVVMDEPSLELLKGSKVDFTMELIGSQFKIVGNPAATSSCGCGTSFDIKL